MDSGRPRREQWRGSLGGIRGDSAVQAAAFAQAMGLDGMRLLTTEDTWEVTVMMALAQETAVKLTEMMELQAVMISNAVWKAVN